jgi:hypothetical protein
VTQEQNRLASIREIVDQQLELVTLSLYVATQGPTFFRGESLECHLGELKLRTSQHIAMCAGQSVTTILRCADWRGIPVRDLYPIARSAIESFINAAYILVESDAVAERAAKYVAFASWKQMNRQVGSGDFSMKLSTSPLVQDATSPEFPEFAGSGNGVWTKLDVPSRFRKVGELAGRKAGSRFLAAYALVYSLSSEIIHGSPYGVNYFFQTHLPPSPTVEDFKDATGKQLEDLLVAVSHAVAGYVSTFFRSQGMLAPYLAEQDLFNKLLALEGVEPAPLESLV